MPTKFNFVTQKELMFIICCQLRVIILINYYVMRFSVQLRIQRDFDTADAVLAPKKKKYKKSSLLKLKMTGKCFKGLFRQCRSIKQVILDTSVIPKTSLDTSLPMDTGVIQNIKGNVRQKYKSHYFDLTKS